MLWIVGAHPWEAGRQYLRGDFGLFKIFEKIGSIFGSLLFDKGT